MIAAARLGATARTGATRSSAVTTLRSRPQAYVRQMSSSTPSSSPSASQLAQSSCEPCRKSAGATKMSDAEADSMLRDSGLGESGWSIIEAVPGEKALSRSWPFKNFRTALAFTSAVGEQAEKEKHHPRLTTEWGAARVDWWTHAVGGLHQNDFVMAAKTDEVARGAEGVKEGVK